MRRAFFWARRLISAVRKLPALLDGSTPECLMAIPAKVAPIAPDSSLEIREDDLPPRTVRIGWVQDRSAERFEAEMLRQSFFRQSHFASVSPTAPTKSEQGAPVEQSRSPSRRHQQRMLPDRPINRSREAPAERP